MRNTKQNQRDKYLLNCAITLLLITSGSVPYLMFHGIIAHLIFAVFPVFFFFTYSGKSNNKSLPFILLYCSYLLINFFVINNTFTDEFRILTYVIFAIGSYLILSKITFEDLADRLIRIVGYMSFLSIIVFLLSELNILSYSKIPYKDGQFCMLLFHTIGWSAPFHRLAGIYWEPGVYQIILNTTLFISINYFHSRPDIKLKKYCFSLCFIFFASVLTLSTTGYFIILLLLGYYFVLNRKKSRNVIVSVFRFSISLLLLVLTSLIVYLSDPVQDKLNQLDNNNPETSAQIRQADALGMLQMITERPFRGYGLATKEYARRSYQLDNRTSSNGNLFTMATFGIPFYAFIIISCFLKFKKEGFPALLSTIFFIILNMGESFMYFPFVFVFFILCRQNTNKRNNLNSSIS